jgi:hypothetical protein
MMALEINNEDIRTALLILATYPLDKVEIVGVNDGEGEINAHSALALIHKVKAAARVEGDYIVIPSFTLRLKREPE